MCCLSVRVPLNQSTCLSPPFDPSYLTLHLQSLHTNHAGAWAGKLVELLKKETQRPAALATLPVVPRKRCIFNVHCPRPQQQIPEPVPCPARVAHTASRSGTGTAGGRETDAGKKKRRRKMVMRIEMERIEGEINHILLLLLLPIPLHTETPLLLSAPRGSTSVPRGRGANSSLGYPLQRIR